MARTTAVRLTGEDLTVTDVWEVAVGNAGAELDDAAREKMAAARAVVEEALGRGRADLRRHDGLRPLRVDPGARRAGRGAAAAPAPEPCLRRRRAVPGRDRARGDAHAGECAREGLLGDAGRGRGAAARLPRPWRDSRGAEPRLGRRERRPRATRASRAAARRRGPRACRRRAALRRRSARPGRPASRCACRRRKGSRWSTARSSWALSPRSGVVRATRLAKAADVACALSVDALQGSRESFLPSIHELRPLPGQAASAANILRLLDDSAIGEAHRWCDHVQDAYSLRCAAQVHGASRDLLAYVERTAAAELNAATDNPLVFAEDGTMLSNGNFHGQPVAFALDALAMAVSELASISERRTERLVNPALSDGLPAVPRERRRAQLRVHDPPVRRRVSRQREQGALPSGERRLDPDERGTGGSRLDGQRGGAEGVAGARERRARAWRSSSSRVRRRSSSTRR